MFSLPDFTPNMQCLPNGFGGVQGLGMLGQMGGQMGPPSGGNYYRSSSLDNLELSSMNPQPLDFEDHNIALHRHMF